MINLKMKSQYHKGFYIWKDKNNYDIGKNGTSFHIRINGENKSNDQIVEEILNYIEETTEKLKF